ncbi:MAG TPA: J domain-containing protein [Polyangiaceae bacterium]|nr:J domain-containing protein [Polyangiaceae bacterium]
MAHDETHYDVLGVTPDAPQQAIKAAYLKLVAQYHPDRHQGNPLEDLARQRLVRINEAYQTLSDPQRRNLYDRNRAHPSPGPMGGEPNWSPRSGFWPRARFNPTAVILLVLALPLLLRIVAPLLRLLFGLLRALLSIL